MNDDQTKFILCQNYNVIARRLIIRNNMCDCILGYRQGDMGSIAGITSFSVLGGTVIACDRLYVI